MVRIYEVMKVRENLPIFFTEHIRRLEQSIQRYKSYSYTELQDISIRLIKDQLLLTGDRNIKLIYNTELDKFSVELIPNRTPSNELYRTGATVQLYDGERVDPLIKRENNAFRKITEDICRRAGLYDLILRNREGYITEGTRSNFLLISKDGTIISSPKGEALNGITRDQIFKICKRNNIDILEQEITIETLKTSVSMIITGTSPGVLPVKSCGEITFTIKNSIIDILNNGYQDEIKNSLSSVREMF